MSKDLQRRAFLTKAVSRMLIILVLAFWFVLFRSLGTNVSSGVGASSNTEQTSKQDQAAFANVTLGQTSLLRVRGQRVWVTRLSELQQTQGKQLTPYVLGNDHNCQLENELCVFSVATTRDGIELRFTARVPAQLPANLPWFGGFVDPSNGQLYDLWGRAYAFQNAQPLAAIQVESN